MTPTRLLGVLALAVALAHLPFLPSTLEDIDSVNFALGVRDFDVAQHRPHPPGYPIYIAAGKGAVAALDAAGAYPSRSALEARALALLSVLASIGLVFFLYRVFSCLGPPTEDRLGPPWRTVDPPALAAVALTMSCPLLWYLTARPMSDLPGLMLVAAAQACLMLAWRRQAPVDGDRRLPPALVGASGRMIVAGACLAGVAIGLRVQTAVLTVPLLALVLIDRIGRGVAGAVIGATLTFTIGALAWGIPLLVASGGLDAYMAALGTQAAEDFAGVQMLYLTPGDARLAAFGVIHTLVDPWDAWPLAASVLALAAAGFVALALRDRRALAAILAMAGPYAVYHLLFQDTAFIRYAAPLVPAASYLAVRGAVFLRPPAAVPVAAILSIWSIAVAAPVLAEYGRESSPATRAVEAMNAESRTSRPAALAMHQTYQRPLEAEDVLVSPQLPSPPRLEWLELVKYWKDGHDGLVWFLADPRRTDLALIDPAVRRDAIDFPWAPASRPAFGGTRPAAARWIRMPAPGWFAEEGWALTPETAGMADGMRRGPNLGPIVARVRRRPGPVRVMVGGRNLSSDAEATFVLAIDGTTIDEWTVKPGFFLRTLDLPAGRLAGTGALAALTIESFGLRRDLPRPATAIEQFDLQDPAALMWGYDDGWYEAEFVAGLGQWRWTSDRATLRLSGAPARLRVTLAVESPLRYFDLPVRARALAGGRELAVATLGASGERAIGATEEWSFEVKAEDLAAAGGRIVVETDHTFNPAERGASADPRRLGLRVFGVTIVPIP